MTPTQSLSERLRFRATIEDGFGIFQEAADALDAKDVQIAAWHSAVLAIVEAAGGLVDSYPTGKHNILQRIRTMRDALDAKDKEIERLKEAHLKLAFAEHDIPWPDALDGHIRRKLRSP